MNELDLILEQLEIPSDLGWKALGVSSRGALAHLLLRSLPPKTTLSLALCQDSINIQRFDILGQLPDDICEKIFYFVMIREPDYFLFKRAPMRKLYPGVQDLLRFTRVSKRWNALLENPWLWKYAFIKIQNWPYNKLAVEYWINPVGYIPPGFDPHKVTAHPRGTVDWKCKHAD